MTRPETIIHSGQGILLDIEGTTSSVSYVYDEMFPFVRRELDRFLAEHWGEKAFRNTCDQIAIDAGFGSFDHWRRSSGGREDAAAHELLRQEVFRLMDGDIKATGLKELQGMIWKSGFESGQLKAHVYDDVPAALETWNNVGCDVRIYSSGSVQAQKLFFQHSIAGDLLHHFQGHYDTKIGGKKEAASYSKIAKKFKLKPVDILFLSDVVAELDAAAVAGMMTGLCVRAGNAEVPHGHNHREIRGFGEILAMPVC